MSMSPRSGARGLERLVCFKDHIVLRWESRFIFRLNATEITDYIKKLFKYKYLSITFRTKKSNRCTCLSPPRVKVGLQRSVCLTSYNVQKWKIEFTLGFNVAKNTRYIKKRFK